MCKSDNHGCSKSRKLKQSYIWQSSGYEAANEGCDIWRTQPQHRRAKCTSRMFREPAIRDKRSTRDFDTITPRIDLELLRFRRIWLFAFLWFCNELISALRIFSVMISGDREEATMAPRGISERGVHGIYGYGLKAAIVMTVVLDITFVWRSFLIL